MKHPDEWRYELTQRHWAPLLCKQAQQLGQVELRNQPKFYLLMKYLVMCRNTGAMHTFRFKHDSQCKTFFEDLNNAGVFTMARTDTLGYLSRYLH